MSLKDHVLLIHPPVNLNLLKEQIVGFPILGYGLLHIAASLAEDGYDVEVWNLEGALLRGSSVADIEEGFQSQRPVVVGVELNWLISSRGALQIAELAKRWLPETPVVFGGTHASLFAREILQRYPSTVDAVLTGEAEKTFPQLTENLQQQGRMGEVGGLVYHAGKQVHEIPLKKADLYTDIDEIPPYSYKYVKNLKPRVPEKVPEVIAVNTTRGACRMKCAYCVGCRSFGRAAFAVHSPEWIVRQMNLLLEEGVKEFAFQDLLFLSGKERLLALAKALQTEGLHEKILGINMTAVPGILDGETLGALSDAGVYNIDYGVESGSDRVLRRVHRPTSTAKIVDAVETTIAKGIIPWTFWMTGLPDERPEDVHETLALIHRTTEVGGLPKWVTPLIVLPGTELFENAPQFHITLRLQSFEDFAVFSDLERKAVSWYPEAISHESEAMNRYEILRSALDLKLAIFERREEITRRFLDQFAGMVLARHPHLSLRSLENIINLRLSYILTAFL
jgi:anaerobic magnesium-protoporphyrin IX monomethyl ester cyclase